jgi:predicted metal-dependent phosphoesterase TrpH
MHSLEDPRDVLEHDAFDLVDRAARLGYQVIALTLHGRVHAPAALIEYAAARGVLLIPGVELCLQGKEVLLLGAEAGEAEALQSLGDLRALRRRRGAEVLTIAPHPFYGRGQCLGRVLGENPDLFDAIELCHFYTSWWNPNRKAEAVSCQIGRPMIACSDTHQLKWMRHHYCRLDAAATKEDVFAAIRAGRIANVTRPLTNLEFAEKLVWHLVSHASLKLGRQMGVIRGPFPPR